ncbi:MAG: glutamyl-tRNA reductase [bacterium]
MNFVVVGTNHKYSPVSFRERLSFSSKKLRETLSLLSQKEQFSGAVILSTCNRVEVYVSIKDPQNGVRELEDFISGLYGIDKGELSSYTYSYKKEDAVKHLYSVACGLDSQILGETQILGQLRNAFSKAQSVGSVDEFLQSVFNSADFFAKRIHRQTGISEGRVSVGSLAIDFIKEKFRGSLSEKKVVIIGVGKVTELVLKYLKDEHPDVVFISSRTYAKAKELAGRIEAAIVRFDKLGDFLKEADIVITATGSPHFVIKKSMLEGIKDKKLLVMDLAVPRDVEPGAKELKNIDLFTLEDLDALAKKNIEKKEEEAKKIRHIINTEAKKLWKRLTESEPEPALLP